MTENHIYAPDSDGLAVTNHYARCEADDQARLLCHLDLGRAMAGWTDTREPCRAVLDALPLLGKAGRIVVVETLETRADAMQAGGRLADAKTWPKGHGVASQWLVERTGAEDRHRPGGGLRGAAGQPAGGWRLRRQPTTRMGARQHDPAHADTRAALLVSFALNQRCT